MPFGLIIQILAALVLLSSAPEAAKPPFSPLWLSLVWFLKLFLWYWVCVIAFKKIGSLRKEGLVKSLQWLSFIPLAIDFYLLGFGYLLKLIFPYEWADPIKELAKLVVLLFYWMVLWIVYWQQEKSAIGGVQHSLGEELSQRIRIIAPILLPFIFLNLLEGLLHALPFKIVKDFLATPWSEALFFLIFALLVLIFIPPLIIKIWKCVELPDGPLRQFIEQSMERQGISFRSIYIWPLSGGTACTAAVLGIFPRWRYILFTPCLLQHLSLEEIEAVLAHEIAHVRHKHLLWYILFLAIYSVVIYQLLEPLWIWCLSKPWFIDLLIKTEHYFGGDQTFLLALPIGISMLLYFRFVMGYFMRHFERQADLGAVEVQGHPYHLISALEKISMLAGDIRNKPSWHHFSIAQRVDFLKRVGSDPSLKARFENSLAVKRYVFLVLCAGLAMMPRALPVQAWQKNARINLAQVYIRELLKKDKHDPMWYLVISQIMYEKGEYQRALDLLKRAEALAPNDPEILNSIAWLYATAKDPAYRNPKLALAYAVRAAKIKPAAHILDTLAESFFINGYVKEAIKIEEEALQKANKNISYYKKQLERFKKCFNEGDCLNSALPAA